jgi:methionine-rich copper-binding protein CopC
MTMRMPTLIAGLLLLAPPLADAHALLRSASPPVGGTVRSAPGEVAITFSEGVEPRFSTIEVRDESGARVDKADPHNGPGGQTRLLVDLPPLKPGRYTVSWSAISVDTHHTEGKFTFTVAP